MPRQVPTSGAPAAEPQAISAHYEIRYPELSRWRRAQIPVIAALVYGISAAIGPTLRYEVLGWPNAERVYAGGRRCIYAFWHRSIFSAMWWWRKTGVVVMNTTNFDGQWTRRVVERFGYLTAQGSSSRGGLKGLVVMARRLDEGHDVAFTIDGPRGPRYVAKPGPVMLARRTGQPIVVFHAGLDRAFTFEKSWDLFQLPRPFARGVIFIAPPIEVAPDADAAEMERKHAEMQRALERVRDEAEAWFSRSPQERDTLRAEWGSLEASVRPEA
jgi:hypothetical protein